MPRPYGFPNRRNNAPASSYVTRYTQGSPSHSANARACCAWLKAVALSPRIQCELRQEQVDIRALQPTRDLAASRAT